MHTNTLGPLLTTTLGIIFLILRPSLFPRRYTLYFSVHAFDNEYHSGEPDFRVQIARGSGSDSADAAGSEWSEWSSELNWAYEDAQLGRPAEEVFRVRSEDGEEALCTISGTYPLDYNMWAFNTDYEGRITLDMSASHIQAMWSRSLVWPA